MEIMLRCTSPTSYDRDMIFPESLSSLSFPPGTDDTFQLFSEVNAPVCQLLILGDRLVSRDPDHNANYIEHSEQELWVVVVSPCSLTALKQNGKIIVMMD